MIVVMKALEELICKVETFFFLVQTFCVGLRTLPVLDECQGNP